MKISVIVPVYNSERYIEKCIKSIENQTYQNVELIIINDGSTDGTTEIIEKHRVYNNKIIVVNKKNKGVSFARNSGIELAKGDYLFFLDSDDWLDNDYFEKCVSEIRKNDVDILFTPYIKEFKNKSIKNNLFQNRIKVFENEESLRSLLLILYGPTGVDKKNPMLLDNYSPVWGKFYRKEVIEKIKFEDLDLIGSEDLWFNINVFKNSRKIEYYGESYLHYNKTNQNSIVSTQNIYVHKQWKNLYGKMQQFITENQLDELYLEALNNRKVLNLFGLVLKIIYSDRNYFAKRKMFIDLLNDLIYKEAFQKFSYENMDFYWRFFYKTVKRKNFFVIYFMLNLANFMKKILNK